MFFEQFMPRAPVPPADTTKYYSLLGVSKSDDEATIKKAYRKLALQHHPDRGGDPEKFKELQKVYEVLSDKDKRALYDEGGEDSVANAASGGAGGGGMPFNMFDFMGGAFGHGHDQRGPKPTVMNMSVPLEQFYSGVTKTLAVRRTVSCTTCKGAGTKSGKNVQCKPCRGQGTRQQLRQVGPGMVQQLQTTCGDCKGTGRSHIDESDKCAPCNGNRVVEEKTHIKLDVERGMKDGERIVFKGEGGSEPGQTAADIVVILQQTAHQTFHRKGEHLVMERSITLLEALTGFKFQLNHLGGRILQVCSAPGMVTKPGDVQRIRGEGMPLRNSSQRGDLLIRFDVVFPMHTQLTPESVAFLEQALPKPQPTPTLAAGDHVTSVQTEMMSTESHRSDSSMYDEDEEQDHHSSGGAPQCRQQ